MNHHPTLTYLVGVARQRDFLAGAEHYRRAGYGRTRRLPAVTVPVALRWPVRMTTPRAGGRLQPADSL